MKKFVFVIASLALLAGCNQHNDVRGRGAAPIGEIHEDEREVFVFPDQYANVAVACDGTSRMYMTTRKGDVAATLVVIPDSPECPGE